MIYAKSKNDTIGELNSILKKNDLNLINKFEDEFMKLIYKEETSTMIIYSNRELIRNAYFLIILLYGEKATFREFQILINNLNGLGKNMLIELEGKKYSNMKLQREFDRILNWFNKHYYKEAGDAYKYSLPTRYSIDRIVSLMDIEENNYSDLKEIK